MNHKNDSSTGNHSSAVSKRTSIVLSNENDARLRSAKGHLSKTAYISSIMALLLENDIKLFELATHIKQIKKFQ